MKLVSDRTEDETLKEHERRQNEIKRWKKTDWRKDALATPSKRSTSAWNKNEKPKALPDSYVRSNLPWLLAISLIFNVILLSELLTR